MSEREMIEEMARVMYEAEYDGEAYPWTKCSVSEKASYLRMAEAAVTKCSLYRKPN